jgi:LPS-assembly protein
MVYVDGVPVLPLPVMFLPLGDRRTGFLLPRPNFTARNGLQIEEPFFWAINGWSDATFTPGYFFGRNDSVQGTPGAEQPGMEGPRLDLELRYVPSTDTTGRLTGALVDDLKSINPSGAGSPRGLRGELGWTHAQALGSGWDDRVDLGLISDQSYFRDVTADLIASQAQYLRSSARIDHHSDDTDLSLSGEYFQNLVIPGCATRLEPAVPDHEPPTSGQLRTLESGGPTFGLVSCDPSLASQFNPAQSLGPYFGHGAINDYTFQRLPDLSFDAEEQRLGPLLLSVEADAVHFGSLSPRNALTAEIDPVAATRSSDTRLDVAPELRLPLLVAHAIEVDPYVQVREDGWLMQDQGTAERTYALVGVTSEADLARSWADSSGTWRNVITPEVELRSVPWSSGSGPLVANDEVDGALDGPPDSHTLQGIASVRTRFDHKEGSHSTEPLRLELGQGMDLAHARLSDSYATLSGQLGLVQASVSGRYDPLGWDGHHPHLAALNSRLSLLWPTGTTVYGQYQLLDPNQTDLMRASLVDLIGPPAPGPPLGDYLAEQVVLGFKAVVQKSWSGSAEATFLPHATEQADVIDRFLAYRVGAGYNSPCDCWGVTLVANFSPIYAGSPWTPLSFMVVLDAQRIEGF